MLISEYSDPAQALATLNTKNSIMKKMIKTILDAVLITSYVVGLIGFMPVFLAYAWAKENWSAQV